jgi:glycosyltransferase involved in cell wall biosynthesis
MRWGGETDLACLVAEIYRQRLRRSPAASELEFWTSKFGAGLKFEEFFASVSNSEEANSKSRNLNEAAIRLVYSLCLRRSPTDDDVEHWQRALADDVPFPQMLLDMYEGEETKSRKASDHKAIDDAVRLTYKLCLYRSATEDDVSFWQGLLAKDLSFPEMLLAIGDSKEARYSGYLSPLFAELSDSHFCSYVLEPFYSRGLSPRELMGWKKLLAEGQLSRIEFLRQSFMNYAGARIATEAAGGLVHDPSTTTIMGTDIVLSSESWQMRAERVEREGGAEEPTYARPYLAKPDLTLVSAIASLYRGEKYIERFLDNITSQSLDKSFELIIVDAASPENEQAVIERYMQSFPNIRYKRMDYRIGIYDAWNVGVELSRGKYLTNTNLDDLRRRDSLEIQAATLESLPFVDVVYQDFLYTLDSELNFEEVERLGFKSHLPIVTPANILRYNSPHNAPMWRRKLHDEVGFFDVSLKSAGDYEFWMRCLTKGKIFYKINIPHVVYFQNPDGISTRPNTRGIEEGHRVMRQYARSLISERFFSDDRIFRTELDALTGKALDLDPQIDFYDMAQVALENLSRSSTSESVSGAAT